MLWTIYKWNIPGFNYGFEDTNLSDGHIYWLCIYYISVSERKMFCQINKISEKYDLMSGEWTIEKQKTIVICRYYAFINGECCQGILVGSDLKTVIYFSINWLSNRFVWMFYSLPHAVMSLYWLHNEEKHHDDKLFGCKH